MTEEELKRYYFNFFFSGSTDLTVHENKGDEGFVIPMNNYTFSTNMKIPEEKFSRIRDAIISIIVTN